MKKNIFKLASFLAVSTIFTSCLKDKAFDNNEYQSLRYTDQKVVSIGLTTATSPNDSANYNVIIKGLDLGNDPVVYDFAPITLSGGIPAEQDVHVVIADDSNIVKRYNNSFGGPFDVPSPSIYTVVNKTITIPKGQSTAWIQVKLTPSAALLGHTFALGFKILSVDGGYTISNSPLADKSKGIVAFLIKNAYEGDYSNNTGIRYNYTAVSVPYTYPTIPSGFASTTVLSAAFNPKYGSTIDANTTQFDFANLGGNGFQYIVTVPPGTSGTSDVTVPLTFSNALLTGNSAISIKVSTYNPSTKTFHFNVAYNNNATNTGAFRIVDEVFVKL